MEEACGSLGEKINPHRILEENPKTEGHFGRLMLKEGIESRCVFKK
jgi:hypothetical protein